MKKILALILATFVLIALVACNGGKNPQSTTIGTDQNTTEVTNTETTEPTTQQTTEPTTPDTTEPTTPDTTEPTTPDTTEPTTPDTTEPTTPDTTEPTTPDTTEPTTPDTTEPTTPDTTEPTTPDTTEPVTPDTTEPTTPDTTEPTTPDTTEPTTPDTTEPTTPDTTEPTTPDTTEPVTPDTTEPTTPDTTEPTTPDTTEPTTPDTTEPTTPDTTEPTTPDTTEPVTPDTTEPTTPDTTEPTTPDTTEPTTPDTTEPTTPDTTEPTTPDTTEPDYELTIEEAIALGKSMTNNKYTSVKYYVTGTVTKIVANKNITITDGNGNEITIVGTFNADGTLKLSEMDEKPAVGDVVTVYGVVGQSNGSARIKDGWIISFETPDTSTDEPVTDTTTEAPTPPPADMIYNNGVEVSGSGIKWESDFFSNTKHKIDQTKAVTITAAELLAKMQNRDGDNALKDGEVWLVEEQIVLEGGNKYYGNGAVIIAKGGILIKDTVDVVFKDAVIDGSLVIENSSELVFYKLDITSADVAVTLTGTNNSDISFKTCRLYGNHSAIVGSADCVTIYKTYVRGNDAIKLSGNEITIQDCKVVASTGAITLTGNDCVIRENTLLVLSSGFGINIGNGSKNALIALNDIQGVQNSITVDGGYNCSVILNRAIIVEGKNCTNLYVVDNSLGGYLKLTDNNYLIVEGNTYPFDGLVHTMVKSGNDNTNGNNITNINARPDVGANEDLLPHTNKELFVGMPRKTIVTDASFTSPKSLGGYIKACGESGDVVIVPPGAYSTNGIVSISSNLANTTVYAYGVYQEYSEQNYGNYVSNQLYISDTSNINVYGLTIGYAIPSCGQIRVVAKDYTDGKYSFTVIPDAGFWDGFTQTDPDLFFQTWAEFFLVDENGEYLYQCDENVKGRHTITRNDDGTMTFTLTATGTIDVGEYKGPKAIWDRVQPGTVITCRLANGNRLSICVSGSKNIKLRDVTVYGYAAAFSAYANGRCENITFERYRDTTPSGTLIDKATYDKYAAIEEKWGVSFEIKEEVVDGITRYRGAPARSSSVDAFHIAGTTTGVNVVSSLLESMVDDGSNQHAASSRLHGYKIEGDIVTLYFKDTATGVNWGNTPNGGQLSLSSCPEFAVGDKIYIYTPDGRTVCETKVLSASSKAQSDPITDTITVGTKTCKVSANLYQVTISKADFNEAALINPDTGAKYILTDNHYNMTNKVTVDNLSRNACDYVLDNVMVLNAHSRGFLIKSRNVTIKHCTFKNQALSGLLIRSETEWAESSVPMNILIQQCLFDNVGALHNGVNEKEQACIRIQHTSTAVSEDSLPIDNITITGCKFTNNTQRLAIWVNSAKNVKITNNIFDDVIYNIAPQAKGTAVLLDVCMNVEISGNTYNYAHYDGNIKNVITAPSLIKNIYGTDVENADGSHIFPDKTTK